MKINSIAFLGLTLAALLNAAVAQDAGDPAVIRLGGEEVTLSEFNRDFEVAVRLLAARQGIPYGKQPPETIARLKQQFLGQRAGELALLREAGRRGITVSEEEVDAQVAEFRASLGGEQDFQATLEEAGFSNEEQLREMAREKQLIGSLTEALGPMAPMIVDDHLSAMHESKNKFPVDRFEQLVIDKGLIIPDEELASTGSADGGVSA